MNEQNYRDQSEMNMAVLTLGRIHESLYLCNIHQREKNYQAWFDELLVLLGEASVNMDGEVTSLIPMTLPREVIAVQIVETKPKTKDEFYTASQMIREIEPELSKAYSNPQYNYRTLYLKLFYLSVFIKEILKKSGILMKLRDDARFSL